MQLLISHKIRSFFCANEWPFFLLSHISGLLSSRGSCLLLLNLIAYCYSGKKGCSFSSTEVMAAFTRHFSHLGSPFTASAFSPSTAQLVGKVRKKNTEKLWRQLFSEPSSWWDHRSNKKNLRYPDFKHKQTQEALWVENPSTPQWVNTELSKLAPGTIPSSAYSWNVRIIKYVNDRQYIKAMELFQIMQRENAKPDNFTFVAVLKACANLTALEEGRNAHAQLSQAGWDSDIFVGNSLVDMYAKCGSIVEAYRVFSGMPTRDVVSWNAMIMGYVKCEMPRMAIELYEQMQQEKIEPDAFTFSGVLNACTALEALEYGKLVHEQVTSMGLQSDSYVGSSLVDMYAKSGRIVDACKVFNDMPVHDVVSWSAMIIGFVNCGHGEKALELFQHMQQEGVEPNVNTFIGVFNACASIMALEEGKFVHAQVIKRGLDLDVFVGSSLVDMYAKCGSMDDACRVFNNMPIHNVVSWSAILGGYAKCGQGWRALEIFQQMQDSVEPDTVTFVGVLKACASMKALEEGKLVHEQVIKSGVESNIFVRSCLVDMYIKCDCVDEAYKVFKKFPVHDVITWSAMILGFVKFGQGEKALESFQQMQQAQVEPDSITYVGLLNACASLAAFQEGRLVHAQVIRRGLDSDMFIGSSLVDMYSKCGSIADACRVFNNMPTRNVVSWSAMIMGYAVHGLGKEAKQLFEKMCQEDVDIDAGIFVCLLSACSHAGLVDQGSYLFEFMSPIYGIQATVEHFSCMVDLLARSGFLIEAEDIIIKMPCRPDSSLWVTLLGSCRNYGNVQMGERAAEHIFRLDPGNAPGHVLLSNVYAAAGKADAAAIIQKTTLKRIHNCTMVS